MRLNDSKKFVSNPGSPIEVIYAPKVTEQGSIDLIEVGCENIQDKIDSFRDECDVGAIVSRYQNTGDPAELQRRIGAYGDFTTMPKTLAEALQLQIDSNRLFESLPMDIKQRFNNDKNQFFAMSGTKEWRIKMDSVLPESMRFKEEVKEEVKE